MPRSSPSTAKTPIDWTAVRARLEHAATSTQAAEKSPQAAATILARRAEALAKPLETDTLPADLIEVVAFQLGEQVFALAAANLRETIFLRDLTRLPGLPDYVRGVVNVRSRVVAALDLRPLLQLPSAAAPADEEEKLLIVDFEGTEFGLVADRVLGVREVSGALRREVPGLHEKYLRGIAADGTILLELATLFPDLVVDDRPEA